MNWYRYFRCLENFVGSKIQNWYGDQLYGMISTQEVIQAQERSISDLLKAVKDQNEHLNGQKNKIKSLENKVVFWFFFVQPNHLYV